MKPVTYSVLTTFYLAEQARAAADGLICVDQFLIDMLEIINDFRTNGPSTAATNLCKVVGDAATEIEGADVWTSEGGVALTAFEQRDIVTLKYEDFESAKTACEAFDPLVTVLSPLNWNEGLTLAGDYFVTDDSSTGFTTQYGESGEDRVNEYGTLTGDLLEFVWKITQAGGMTAQDLAVVMFLD